MPKDDGVYVGHMLEKAEQAVEKIKGKTRKDFDLDNNLELALEHLLQIIGEAARNVSQDFQKAHPEIPWRAIIGMRHKGMRDDLNVDQDIVWDTVTEELVPLIHQLKKITG